MPDAYFQYWKLEQARRALQPRRLLDHSAGEQLDRVKLGDTLWIVTVDSGQLKLVGSILVGDKLNQKKAIRKHGPNVYPSSHHVEALPGTEQSAKLVDLMDIAHLVRFQATGGKDRLVITGQRVNAQQLQSTRKLTPDTSDLMARRWGLHPAPDAELPPTSEIEKSISGGAGFGNAEQNRLVEEAAIEHVKSLYISDGWNVKSRERDKCGYDLVCRKRKLVDNVEVKGISGRKCAFIITNGEVIQAKTNPHFVLYAVTEALSNHRAAYRFSGEEFLDQFELKELAFRAKLR